MQAVGEDPFITQLRQTLAEVLQESLTYQDTHRYLFLKWIKGIIMLALKNIVVEHIAQLPPTTATDVVRLKAQIQ